MHRAQNHGHTEPPFYAFNYTPTRLHTHSVDDVIAAAAAAAARSASTGRQFHEHCLFYIQLDAAQAGAHATHDVVN